MKILHITASMDPKLGGVCQAVKTIIKGLNNFQNVQNEVVSFDHPDASFIGEKSYSIHALGLGKTPWFYNAVYIPWLLQNLPDFDTVILHGLWNYQGYGLVKALRMLRSKQTHAPFNTKFFVMPHGMLDPYFQKASGRKLKAIRNWFYWKLVERKVINQTNGLLFTCGAELKLARKTFTPYHPVKELVVGLGVEEPPVFTAVMREAFSSSCPDLADNPYLLFISRIHEKKGVDMLIDAYGKTQGIDEMNEKQHDASFSTPKFTASKLVVAGPGTETPYGQKIKNSVLKLQKTATTVFFPGMLTGNAKWGAFYGCEAFVLPSHQENFGIAAVEALACGKPVLISNQVNIWTEIAAAEAGIIADDTAAGTQQLLENWNNLTAKQKTEMGRNARKCYEKHFADGPAAINFLRAITT
ncbi:glycosyltransferase [Mucilaginibacter arboris]|uniref:Glycosyltransferase n=1 Tax=Mucilaginibacter arboris TaxID=2682090 RepID=A0A7K1SY80_9SPHI|nr:glycosyltransferase [Mucilaginibacter arboris]MVN22218.1 glycosyltransferase [Mucilaginibacter arboris]